MMIIEVRDANAEIILRTQFNPDYGMPDDHAKALIEEVFEDKDAFYDSGINRWYTEDGEEAIWYEM